MKFLLLFFLSSFTAYSQVKEHFYNEFGLPIDSLILGEWELEKVEIIDRYNEIKDSNRFVSNSLQNHTLSIFADSIVILPDLSSRYYRRNKVFEYLINQPEYRKNPVLQLQEVNKFKPRTRKRSKKIFHYEIISCTDEKLVLLYSSFVDDGLASPTVSHLYTYKKPTISTAIDSLIMSGYWRICSETYLDFLSDNSMQTFEFQKVDTIDLGDCPNKGIDLEFKSNNNFKTLTYSTSSHRLYVVDGFIGQFQYRLDTQNKLLYVLSQDVYVYNILLVNENQLTLVLNKSLTDKLNQRMK